MSLLLDARKKTQQAHQDTATSEPGLSPSVSSPFGSARSTGQNLFNVKAPAASAGRVNNHQNLLLTLGGVILLLAAGAAYVWYLSPSDTSAVVARTKPVIATAPNNLVANIAPPIAPEVPPTASTPVQPAPATQSQSATQVTRPDTRSHTQSGTRPVTPRAARPSSQTELPLTPKNNAVQIVQQAESIDPLLNNAYLAYRSKQFEQSQQLYGQVLKLDANNTDALLGMAVIAQHRGSDNEAKHYYLQVLVLDPRNAVANAGMSALNSDDNRESRLKNLLSEQRDSSSLHFALGNQYAAQSRWGEAQQAYANAYRLEPDNAELAFNLAVSLDRLGKKELAAQHYQRALQLDPSHSAGFDHAQIEQRVQQLTR